MGGDGTYVKLPPLNVLPGVLVRDYNHETRDLAADHPLVQLPHDALNVRLYLVIGGDCALLAGSLLRNIRYSCDLRDVGGVKASRGGCMSSEELVVGEEGRGS